MITTETIGAAIFLFFSSSLFAQQLDVRLVADNGKYKGKIQTNNFDSLIINPSNNTAYNLLGANGILYNSKKGNLEFKIDENKIDETSELLLKIGSLWYPLYNMSFTDDSLKFAVDWAYKPLPNKLDLEVLKLADDILTNESSWNREDDRVCDDDADNQQWSLYCALYSASVQVYGDFYRRNAALNMVRSVIKDSSSNKYRHPLMDFNNEVAFKEIKAILDRSINELDDVLAENGR